MFQKLAVFQIAGGMAKHAAQRQALIARNMANADTPGFQAKDVTPFQAITSRDAGFDLRASRARHLHGHEKRPIRADVIADGSPASPNGNTVSLEYEMVRSVEAERQHNRALLIYRTSRDLLRTALGQ